MQVNGSIQRIHGRLGENRTKLSMPRHELPKKSHIASFFYGCLSICQKLNWDTKYSRSNLIAWELWSLELENTIFSRYWFSHDDRGYLVLSFTFVSRHKKSRFSKNFWVPFSTQSSKLDFSHKNQALSLLRRL